VTKYTSDNSNFGADGPFFRIIREGLAGLADGEDYFDLLADDVVVEYVISVPGYPRRVAGRQAVINLYSGYDDYMAVHTADNLRVYRDPEASVAVLEYEVHGESVLTGRPYNNRFASIITIKDRKDAGDYAMNPQRDGQVQDRPDSFPGSFEVPCADACDGEVGSRACLVSERLLFVGRLLVGGNGVGGECFSFLAQAGLVVLGQGRPRVAGVVELPGPGEVAHAADLVQVIAGELLAQIRRAGDGLPARCAVAEARPGARFQAGQPDGDRSRGPRELLAGLGVFQCLARTVRPVGDQGLEPPHPGGERGVLGVVGAQQGSAGVGHRRVRVAEVV
jgi:ketosteroid isomerase-like protein